MSKKLIEKYLGEIDSGASNYYPGFIPDDEEGVKTQTDIIRKATNIFPDSLEDVARQTGLIHAATGVKGPSKKNLIAGGQRDNYLAGRGIVNPINEQEDYSNWTPEQHDARAKFSEDLIPHNSTSELGFAARLRSIAAEHKAMAQQKRASQAASTSNPRLAETTIINRVWEKNTFSSEYDRAFGRSLNMFEEKDPEPMHPTVSPASKQIETNMLTRARKNKRDPEPMHPTVSPASRRFERDDD